MENRIEALRAYLDGLVQSHPRGALWFVDRHMFAVSNYAALLAMKRGLDVEMATMIGLLHDIHTLLTDQPANHAALSSMKAGEMLGTLGIVTPEEREVIVRAIRNHSDKQAVDDAYSELAKDADVLAHYFFNVTLPVPPAECQRLEVLLRDWGLDSAVSQIQPK